MPPRTQPSPPNSSANALPQDSENKAAEEAVEEEAAEAAEVEAAEVEAKEAEQHNRNNPSQ